MVGSQGGAQSLGTRQRASCGTRQGVRPTLHARHALQVLSGLLLRAELSDYERSQIELLLNQCDVVIGACERIYSTAMPLAYNRHARGAAVGAHAACVRLVPLL